MEKLQSTILDCFPKLIEGNDKERIDSGIALVKYLSDKNWVRLIIFDILHTFIVLNMLEIKYTNVFVVRNLFLISNL